MRRRLRKKWHKRILESYVVDLSQDGFWRRKLLDGPVGYPHPIDSGHLEGVPVEIANQVVARALRYDATVVAKSDAPPWASEGDLVPFRFRAREFPSVLCYSGNNAAVGVGVLMNAMTAEAREDR